MQPNNLKNAAVLTLLLLASSASAGSMLPPCTYCHRECNILNSTQTIAAQLRTFASISVIDDQSHASISVIDNQSHSQPTPCYEPLTQKMKKILLLDAAIRPFLTQSDGESDGVL